MGDSGAGGGGGGAAVAAAAGGASNAGGKSGAYQDKNKPAQVRASNIMAARALADCIRTSLGPKGMDKMIQAGDGDVTITNDGATIMKMMQVMHPAAKMLVELSQAQDVEAGDGTTSVVVIAGSLLAACERLLAKGIHPTIISNAFQAAAKEAVTILEGVSQPVKLSDRENLIKSVTTSLNSKVVSQHSATLAPLIVDAMLKVVSDESTSVDLRDIKIVKKLEGTIEDTELIDGLLFDQKASHAAGGVDRIEKAKIGLIQFCLSPPKTDMDNQVVVSDYTQMDRILREERQYLLEMCKKIKKAGCNVLLIQKSILRDAVNEMALHFLAKLKIMVISDIERNEIDFICKSVGCRPVAHIDNFTAEQLGSADLVEEISVGSSHIVKVTGCGAKSKAVSILVKASNKLILDEAERSIHDALCVLRCLVKKRFLIAGGGAPEIEVSRKLAERAQTLVGMEAYCIRAFAEALEIVPFTLAENAGLNPIATVTELRNRHMQGETTAGINVRKSAVSNILEENVLQPLLVSTSAITLAAETVRSIMKIDDIISTR
eukprot:m.100062 g.100062  ORF g.100062 m.100062 type:complete len:548 (-) comp15610_c0_seq1:225-1868(-)